VPEFVLRAPRVASDEGNLGFKPPNETLKMNYRMQIAGKEGNRKRKRGTERESGERERGREGGD